ncbi:hypothetical protein TWF506_008629 [Arthrobotrys conoides]|uniref:Uncharacterized protein n=1 Tax=Arthrobotrys conoides TaxID=74498 RepID=A0AAN8NQ00_9PEZI
MTGKATGTGNRREDKDEQEERRATGSQRGIEGVMGGLGMRGEHTVVVVSGWWVACAMEKKVVMCGERWRGGVEWSGSSVAYNSDGDDDDDDDEGEEKQDDDEDEDENNKDGMEDG